MVILSPKLSKLWAGFLKGSSASANLAKTFLSTESEKYKFNYIDFDMNDGKLNFTYLPANVKTDAPWKHTSRTSVKLAKVITSLLPSTSEDTLRDFIQKFSAHVTAAQTGMTIELVEGELIRERYNSSNYVSSGGNLGSCMSSNDVQYKLDFYVYNSNIQLLTVMDRGKVGARALVFTAYRTKVDKSEPVRLLGRVYSCSETYRSALNNWAVENLDYVLSGTSAADIKTNKSVGGTWYIPLDVPLLNYYPYVDHFGKIITRYQALTNDTCAGEEFVNLGSPPSYSKGGRLPAQLDPNRPGMVWVNTRGRWEKEASCAYDEVSKTWMLKPDMITCGYCKKQTDGTNTNVHFSFGRICNSHTVYRLSDNRIVLREEASKCRNCNVYDLNTALVEGNCKTCAAKLTPCGGCGKSSMRTTYPTKDGLRCIGCVDANYRWCAKCTIHMPKSEVTNAGCSKCTGIKPAPSGQYKVKITVE